MNKYAIVKKGNHQFFLEEGEILDLPRMNIPEGKEYIFEDILALGTDKQFYLGTPLVEKAKVKVFVVKHTKGSKERGFKYKSKSRYRKTWGYRTLYTRVRVVEVLEPGAKTSKSVAEKTTSNKSKTVSKATKDSKTVKSPKKSTSK